eukprot:CAMPEP_0180794874 /NCGR_PEP_ID=MMETSP1038_2-20121128/55876_1 /TAXON_ID=632150 /ORGANISM="Azadinium spinosum, Strain 3D9" /LENGTH=150 /DNA_ID=CAMNT_0022833711 /DNA_START=29 /DNA_END=481 /DNA_ORIENTATION=-
MPLDGHRASPSNSPPRSRRQRVPSRSRSRGSSPVRKPKPPDTESVSATCEIVEGVPKDGGTTWRAEISIPRPATGRFQDMKETFINIRGPSRTSTEVAEEDGDKMVDAAKTKGMDGCRKVQRELNSRRLVSSAQTEEPRNKGRSCSRSRS